MSRTKKPWPPRLAWVDVETTGLSPHNDDVIELACIITDIHGRELERWDTLVRPTPLGAQRLQGNRYVHQMHTKSGLLAELERGGGLEPKAAYARLQETLERHDKASGLPILAGFSVHFDKRFLEAKRHCLRERWSYQILDVSSLALLFRAAGAPRHSDWLDVRHRALADCEAALSQWRRILAGTRHFVGGEAPNERPARPGEKQSA